MSATGADTALGERPQLTATDYALAELRTQLLSGALAAGTRIDQAEIAKRLGVSLVPIREALARLQSVGLVEIVPHRGVFVANVTADELVDIYSMREMLEEQASRLAAPRLTESDLAALRDIALAMGRAAKTKDYTKLLEHNRELHFTIYRATGRRHMLQVIERLWDLSARYAHLQLHAVPERAAESMFEVRRIVQACERRDPDALGLMVRYKLHQTRAQLLERMALAESADETELDAEDRLEPRARRRARNGSHGARAVSR